jgi:hypothetical protein
MATTYQQVRKYRDVPYTGGMCLKATQDAFSPPDDFKKQEWAMQAWDMEVNSGAGKSTLPPAGVSVPVWFDLTKANTDRTKRGHIAISLANGTVASASLGGYHKNLYIHRNISDLMTFYGQGIKYLGWSTWLEGVQIAKEVASGGGGGGVPAGYTKLDSPRHGAVYKKSADVIFACDKGAKGGTIKFLYYQGRDYLPTKVIKLEATHKTEKLESPRLGAKVKFTKAAVVGFSQDLQPRFIYQSGVDWV